MLLQTYECQGKFLFNDFFFFFTMIAYLNSLWKIDTIRRRGIIYMFIFHKWRILIV